MVDDSSLITHAAAILLKLLGFEVRTAASGDIALSIVSAVEPVAVFIDLCLPGLSGWEVAQQIRVMPLAPRPKLFAITALPEDAVRPRALAVGFDDVIPKPFGRIELERALSSVRDSSG